jgi:hypothetical protein
MWTGPYTAVQHWQNPGHCECGWRQCDLLVFDKLNGDVPWNWNKTTLIAFFSFQAKDFKVAYNTCTKQMDSGYGPIWTACEKLAETNEFHDIQAK